MIETKLINFEQEGLEKYLILPSSFSSNREILNERLEGFENLPQEGQEIRSQEKIRNYDNLSFVPIKIIGVSLMEYMDERGFDGSSRIVSDDKIGELIESGTSYGLFTKFGFEKDFFKSYMQFRPCQRINSVGEDLEIILRTFGINDIRDFKQLEGKKAFGIYESLKTTEDPSLVYNGDYLFNNGHRIKNWYELGIAFKENQD
jgi:hypothetical protein